MALDRKAKFPTGYLSRGQIADDLNMVMDGTLAESARFKKSDERLTDDLCQKYAEGIGKMQAQAANESWSEDAYLEAEWEYQENFLIENFGIDSSELVP